ncbi:MAG TPA: decaprenylphospho-beta-D-erythro-pentofuranosid-2-ulose 2-reductase [Acidimicrobiales bacterium]|nr:decaprenylphospho-beta-D-erythro-pentofuranosid-2-ulose 2-reductase [Acidimicrobiales bacterium]
MRDALGRPQTVAVFGGTSEIGRSVVDLLLRRGAARVVLAGRDTGALEDVARDLRRRHGARADVVPFEAADRSSHERAVDEVFAGGDVDVVLVAFGVLGDQERDERDPAAAAEVVDTNFTAAVSVGVAVAGHLRVQGHGTLVVLSSVAGERARRSNFVYGASKAGMDAFYQGLGAALAPEGVHVMVVRPGFVKTRMTAGMKPAPLATTPEAVAQVVVAGLDRGARTVWAPPPLRAVMTVLRHLPTPVFRRLPL